MATDYKIEFKDVNASFWRVWIKDTAVPRPKYDVSFWEDAHDIASGFYVNFWANSWPENAAYAIYKAVPTFTSHVDYTVMGALPINSSPPSYLLPAGSYYYSVSFYDSNNVFIEYMPLSGPLAENNIVELRAAGPDPVRISTLNNDDDKLSPIRPKQCVIKFLNTGEGVSLATFSGGDSQDDRWKVIIEKCAPDVNPIPENMQTVFVGFLELDDLEEPLQEPLTVVQLTASDKLGSLKEVSLKTFLGARPVGIYPIITYIAMALAGTGLLLSISCCDNTIEQTNGMTEIYSIEVLSAARTIILIPGDIRTKLAIGRAMRITISGTSTILYVASFYYSAAENKTYIEFNVAELPPGTYPNVEIIFYTQNHFDASHLDARTFDRSNYESENCYTVLEKILGKNYFITQENGAWWVMNIGEMRDGGIPYRTYNNEGAFRIAGELYPIDAIGKNENICLTNAAAVVKLNRPAQKVQLNYEYEGPENALANENYTEGGYIGAETIPHSGYAIWGDEWEGQKIKFTDITSAKYNLNGWTLWNVNTATGQLSYPNTSSIIRRYSVDGVEKQREIAILTPTGGLAKYYLENDANVPIEAGDKVLLSFEVRWPASLEMRALDAYALKVAQVLLYGDSGKVYSLIGGYKRGVDDRNIWNDHGSSGIPNKWWLCWRRGGQTTNGKWIIVKNDHNNIVDGGGEYSAPVPENGYIKIRLCHFADEFVSGDLVNGYAPEVLFRNIKLDVKRYIGANLLQARGQFARVVQQGNYRLQIEENQFIDNSPKRIYKGALLVKQPDGNGGYGFDLAGNYANWAYSFGKASGYAQLMVRAMWKQFRNVYRTIRAQAAVKNDVDMRKVYTLEPGVINAHVTGKYYAILSYDWDIANCNLDNMTMAEIYAGYEVDKTGTVEESGFLDK